jgi:hypothetical protein
LRFGWWHDTLRTMELIVPDEIAAQTGCRIPMPYDERDLAADIQTLREVFPRRDSQQS